MAEIGHHLDLSVLFVAAFTALLLQIAANLLNDVSDFYSGVDTAARMGPVRVTQAGWLTPTQVYRAAALILGLATMGGVYLVSVGGWPILLIGLLCIGGAVAYSLGPFQFARHALGEVAAFLFFGIIAVVGSAYLQNPDISSMAIEAAVPIGILVSMLMLVNNLRDIDTDQASGKITLAVLLGADRARALYLGGLILALAWPLALLRYPTITRGVLLPWVAFPLAIAAARSVWNARSSEDFIRALGDTAILHAVYGVLLAVGILW